MQELVSVKEDKAGFSEIVNRAAYGRERIVITSRGKAKAVLISIEEPASLRSDGAQSRVADAITGD